MKTVNFIVALAAIAGTLAACAQETSYPRYSYSQATCYPAGYYPSGYSYPTSYGYRATAYEYRNYNGIHPGPETWP
jgi:hypothetical protein